MVGDEDDVNEKRRRRRREDEEGKEEGEGRRGGLAFNILFDLLVY